MADQWHGGKGDRRRRNADDKKYRSGWERIFGNEDNVNGKTDKAKR